MVRDFKARRYYACAMCWLTTSEIEKAAVKQTGNHQSLRQYGGLRQKSEMTLDDTILSRRMRRKLLTRLPSERKLITERGKPHEPISRDLQKR